MLIEFEKRVNQRVNEVREAEQALIKASIGVEVARKLLQETVSLFDFYKKQMVDKGRILPGGEDGSGA